MTRARLAWWRRDRAELARLYASRDRSPLGNIPRTVEVIVETMLDGAWAERGRDIVAAARQPSASRRRRAFDAQLAAETAGYFDDAAACAEMIELAADVGAYDLHWLDRCPMLECVRGPRIAQARARYQRRARAIFDAMYGDSASAESADTLRG